MLEALGIPMSSDMKTYLANNVQNSHKNNETDAHCDD
jgi:hypothetical protein